MDTDKIIKKAFYTFLIVFSFMCISGVAIIFISYPENTVVDSEIKATIENRKISIELKTGIPGIFLVVMGAIGLLTLLIKIPVKQVFKVRDYPNHGDGFLGLTINTSATKLVHRDVKIPLFLFWVLRKKLYLYKFADKDSG